MCVCWLRAPMMSHKHVTVIILSGCGFAASTRVKQPQTPAHRRRIEQCKTVCSVLDLCIWTALTYTHNEQLQWRRRQRQRRHSVLCNLKRRLAQPNNQYHLSVNKSIIHFKCEHLCCVTQHAHQPHARCTMQYFDDRDGFVSARLASRVK